MHIASLFLAEEVWKKNGQLSALGILHQWRVYKLPAKATFKLVFRVEVNNKEGEDFSAINLTIIAPDGNQVGKASIVKDEQIRFDHHPDASFVLTEDFVNFDEMPIDQAGRYEISAQLDDSPVKAALSLDVILVPPDRR